MKSKLKFIPLIPLVLISMMLGMSYMKANPNPYPESKADSEVPKYTEISLGHTHNYNKIEHLPVIGSAIIDIDNDGVPEVFIGGGGNQDDGLYKYTSNGFKAIEGASFNKGMNDATYGASVVDFNADGKDDLLLARESGGYLYLNQGGTFSETKIGLHLNEKSRPISYALGDLNNDGHIDLYVSAYLTKKSMEGENIFNQEGYGGTSVLLINNGDNTFTDITESSGLSYTHNAFVGIFVDMDDDLDLDLVVAHDTGHVKTWRNDGDLKFTDSPNPFTDVYGYPMGIGAGDYNNDGKIDFYFSNVGPTAPRFLAKGDLRDDQVFYTDLMLMQNQGGMKFLDASKGAKLSDYEFSWGITMTDLNLDGRQDVVISQNYVGLPFQKIFKLPGRMLLQNSDGTFASVEKEAAVENHNYELASIFADFNNDGYPDQIRVNLSGKSKAFISSGGENKHLKVKLPSTAGNFGSKVTVELDNGTKLTDWFLSGEGVGSDQDHTLIFGLGSKSSATKVTVTLPSGKVTVRSVTANQKLISIEN